MNLQPLADWFVTLLVLAGVFLLAYSAVRKQGIGDTWEEIKQMIEGGTDKTKEVLVYK